MADVPAKDVTADVKVKWLGMGIGQFITLVTNLGLGVILAWLAFGNLSSEQKAVQEWMRNEFVVEIKNNTEANTRVAEKLDDVADRIDESAKSNQMLAMQLEQLKSSNMQLITDIGELIKSNQSVRAERMEPPDDNG